jgi:hypothetical protein
MFKSLGVPLAAGVSALFLAGCGARSEPGADAAPPGTRQVTLHVPDMTKLLEITCPD